MMERFLIVLSYQDIKMGLECEVMSVVHVCSARSV